MEQGTSVQPLYEENPALLDKHSVLFGPVMKTNEEISNDYRQFAIENAS